MKLLKHLLSLTESVLTLDGAFQLAKNWLMESEFTESVEPGTGNNYHNAQTNQFGVNVFIVQGGNVTPDEAWILVDDTPFTVPVHKDEDDERYFLFYDEEAFIDHVGIKLSIADLHSDPAVNARIQQAIVGKHHKK